MEPTDMDIDSEMYDDELTQPRKPIKPQPTAPQFEMEAKQEFLPAPPLPTTPFARGVPTVPLHLTTTPISSPASVSRRKFMGVSIAGLAAIGGAGTAAAIGGVAMAKWLQNGGLGDVFHGPMASNTQIGHLLRRAGFGATPDELTMYRNLGFNGAVDRLINYQQVPDDDMENRLKALNINLNFPLNQQRWWLVR